MKVPQTVCAGSWSPLLICTAVAATCKIDDHDTDAYQQQGKNVPCGECFAAFVEEKGGEQNSHDGIDEAEDGYFTDRIIFEQDAPQRIGSGGDKAQIQKIEGAGGTEEDQLASHQCADRNQDQASEEKLVSAQHNRILLPRKDLDEAS